MGFFSRLNSTYQKSKAAAVVQSLLEEQVRAGMLSLQPAALANKLTELAWTSYPDVFDGKFGQRPNKITVVACALAKGVEVLNGRNTDKTAVALLLGKVLSELETNGSFYPLSSADHKLLEGPIQTFRKTVLQEFSLGSEFDLDKIQPRYTSWEAWYNAYKVAAGRENAGLMPTDEGISVIDLMEHEPLRRAFQDGKDPVALGTDFGKEFDFKTFGR